MNKTKVVIVTITSIYTNKHIINLGDVFGEVCAVERSVEVVAGEDCDVCERSLVNAGLG
jgi:hypothetical protein